MTLPLTKVCHQYTSRGLSITRAWSFVRKVLTVLKARLCSVRVHGRFVQIDDNNEVSRKANRNIGVVRCTRGEVWNEMRGLEPSSTLMSVPKYSGYL